MLGEDAAVVILFLVLRRIDGEPLGSVRHLLIGHGSGRDGLEGVYPRVAHAVAELLLLTPCHLMGQDIGKGLAHDALLDGGAGTHLGLGVGAHGHVEKLLVQEGHPPLHAPCGQALVGAQAVVEIEFGELAHGLFVEGLGRGSLVEVEVAAKDLVGTLAGEHHLDAHRLDDTRQQVHGGGGTHGGDIVSLDEVYDIADGIEAFLDGIVDLMVHGADIVGHQPCLGQVWGPLEAYGKRVEARPPRPGLSSLLDTAVGKLLGEGGDDR